MRNDGTKRDNLKIGSEVEVSLRGDREGKTFVRGIVRDVLTRKPSHPHGILVRLESGEEGRVKEVLTSASQTVFETDKSSHIQNKSTEYEESIEELINRGENHFVEFKSSMLWSERMTPEQIKKNNKPDIKQYGRAASVIIIAKTIAGFLNSDGGALIIGIKENKASKEDEIIGIESEFGKLKDPGLDGYRRKILDSVVKPYLPVFIFNHFNNYLGIEFSEINAKQVCGIRVNKSDTKVFLNIQNKDRFFVRIDASTRELNGEQIVDFCLKRFG